MHIAFIIQGGTDNGYPGKVSLFINHYILCFHIGEEMLASNTDG